MAEGVGVELTTTEKRQARYEKRVQLLLRILDDPRIVAKLRGILMRRNP